MVAKTPGRKPKGRKLNPETVDRRIRALEMRRAGAFFEEIAAELGYANASGAFKAVESGLRETLRESATALRSMELERLNELTKAFWPKALAGDGHAADRVVAFMKRRSELLGLDAPTKTQEVPPKGYHSANSPQELYRPES